MADNEGSGGTDNQKNDQAGGDDQKNQQKNVVAYESYQKALDEKKRIQKDLEAKAAKLKEYEQKELETTGKSQELLASLREELKKKEETLEKVVGNFAKKSVESVLMAEAAKLGCVDNELFKKAVDLSKLEVSSEDFSVNADDMKRVMDETVNKHPWLFKKGAQKFNDKLPSNQKDSPVEFTKMKESELLEAWKNLK